jgi:hypothetical protein
MVWRGCSGFTVKQNGANSSIFAHFTSILMQGNVEVFGHYVLSVSSIGYAAETSASFLHLLSVDMIGNPNRPTSVIL